MPTNEKDNKRILTVLIGLLFVLTFFLVNAQQYAFGFLIYIVLGVLSVVFYIYWGKIFTNSDLEGISDKWFKHAALGLLAGIVVALAGQIIPGVGVIGTPTLSQSIVDLIGIVGKFFIIVICASIFEGVFLVNFLIDFLERIKVPKFLAIGLMAGISSAFHFYAYGLGSSGAFLSAFIMFTLFGAMNEKQNDVIGMIFFHAFINWWLVFGKAIFLG